MQAVDETTERSKYNYLSSLKIFSLQSKKSIENKLKEKQGEIEIQKDKYKIALEQREHKIKTQETYLKKLQEKIAKRDRTIQLLK